MRGLLVLIALFACGCDRQSQQKATAPAPSALDELRPAQAPASKPPAELDRMILAGYTPHGSHLHPPGVKECPLAQGSEAVM
jgi:hypothetical protein